MVHNCVKNLFTPTLDKEPKKVKTIQFATFENCVNLKKVNMKSVTSIERRAFCGDKKLKKVKLNKKVKVGKKAFLFTKVKGQKTT